MRAFWCFSGPPAEASSIQEGAGAAPRRVLATGQSWQRPAARPCVTRVDPSAALGCLAGGGQMASLRDNGLNKLQAVGTAAFSPPCPW